jgi:RNA polymerase sigma-70 factor (ECF subfamily)
MQQSDKEILFTNLIDQYKDIIVKACYIYNSDKATFSDLYQEVLINLWQGIDSFRGEAKMSTWIYRTAINTCITWHRKNVKHLHNISLDDITIEIPTSDSTKGEELRQMYQMISNLEPLEKAIITLWLDENSYEDIAEITGISRANVAIKLHRIKDKLIRQGNQ